MEENITFLLTDSLFSEEFNLFIYEHFFINIETFYNQLLLHQ